MSSNDMFAHRDPCVAIAMGRIAGIVRRYGTVVNTAKDPAAVFIRRRMYRRSDIGRTSQEQRQVIETALCIMQERGLIVTAGRGGRPVLRLGNAMPPPQPKPQRSQRPRGRQSGGHGLRRVAAATAR